MPTIGFLHTAEVHVETFAGLVAERSTDVGVVHEVRADLLDAARRRPPDTPSIETGIAASLAALAGRGADVIVCTCSTIGGLAERVPGPERPGVVRIDRPMAARAVRHGRRIAVVAAVESAIEPALALLHEEAVAAGSHATIESHPCLDAWPLFEAGDLDDYLHRIAGHIDAIDASYDTVVLAQATMARAADLVTDPSRVRSSPAVAVEAALAMARAR